MSGLPAGRDRWLAEWPQTGHAEAIVICLPEAGGLTNQFQPLQQHLGSNHHVLAVQLPGRQARRNEAPLGTITEVVAALLPILLKRLDRPFLILGQSMGALIGYELARALGHQHHRWPLAMVLASALPPADISASARAMAQDTDPRALLAGTGEDWDIADLDDDTLEVLLAPLRADAAMMTRYHHQTGPPLHCPLAIWHGADDHLIARPRPEQWQPYTDGPVSITTFSGGHTFATWQPGILADAVRRTLDQHRRPEPEGIHG
ncbi:thioesterase II family protein [Kitasatospora sp. NPDC094011]|uniref:thioesterase II family protein n=1 Tax=Kitasatospora sp. NPDC094011 TaxID=3364090 RepID=UPI0038026FBA